MDLINVEKMNNNKLHVNIIAGRQQFQQGANNNSKIIWKFKAI